MQIIYAGTPHAQLRNVGDHAQAVCIHRWFARHWPGVPVREFTKAAPAASIKEAVEPGDLISIHSGGNMANRAVMSETSRREVVRAFPNHQIVSLPQTISFSGSVLEKSKAVYNSHPDLTILARDVYSYGLALEHFPGCRIGLAPDFVLGYAYDPPSVERSGALLCLRGDDESVITDRLRGEIETTTARLAGSVETLDTSVSHDIWPQRREKELVEMLDRFSRRSVVVTDRLHGLIFAIVAGTPCVVLETVDHKLAMSHFWFRELRHVVFAGSRNYERALAEALDATADRQIDWWGEWYDRIPAFLSKTQSVTSLDHVIRRRRSYRKWLDLPVSRRLAERIVRAGIEAPTGANAQCVRFRLLDDRHTIARLGRLKGWPPNSLPPAVILVAYDFGTPGTVLYRDASDRWRPLTYQDTAAAMQNMCLAADAVGLSACWVSLFPHDRELKAFLPGELGSLKIISALFLGYCPTWRYKREKMRHQGRGVLKSSYQEYTF